jgi:CRP/FNR family transcriptional regulator
MVEQPVEAVLIPDNVFRDWVDRYALWREFTFSLLSLRLTSVLTLVEDIVFRRMEARVASFLRQRCQIENPISVTHQEIATELGNSREVISRILECFTAAGLIRSARGIVEILDFDSLNARSSV